ncbi:MAG: maleylacetoacetate isomerase [Aquabacterium sp.]|nr:maleylacetoacetate isomerase [Aquabacterium sp.]
MRLHTYFRSSAAFRVRIALHLKGLEFEAVPVHLLRGGGEQHTPDYRAKNPLGTVPTLIDNAATLTQSLAMIEYLDETHPQPPLMPADALDRARVRALAQTIACDIHPLNNLRVLNYLKDVMGADQTARDTWYRHWVENGLAGVESLLANDARTGLFCHGDAPTLADCCLLPQVFNARRLNCDLSAMPVIARIVGQCEAVAAFQRAMPGVQVDAPLDPAT